MLDQFDTPALTHFISDYSNPTGPDLLARTDDFFTWQESRRQAGLWPYSLTIEAPPTPECSVRNELGARRRGLNFASQDYLSLSTHPAVLEAAHRAIDDYGVHGAGSSMLSGNTVPLLRLEQALAEHLQTPHVALFSTGWGAGFGTVSALVRPSDHVIMDSLAHACLQKGAYTSTKNVTRVPHLSNAAVLARLQEIRAHDTSNGILVISETLFSMDSDVPQLDELQAMCREHGATLMLDMAHDLGSMGPGGTGFLGAQKMLGKVDLVMGSFSKTFASNGGFVATHSPAVRQFIRLHGGPHTFSNALSPVQAAVVLEGLRIVRSEEGDTLRASCMRNIQALREGLGARGLKCLGEPSPVVPVQIGDPRVARVAARLVFERGVLANIVEHPAVRQADSRFRMQVMAKHTPEQALRAAEVVANAVAEAREMVSPARPRAAAVL